MLLLLIVFSSAALAGPRYATTIYPFQEILKNVVGTRGEVFCLMPPGASPHTFEIRPSDIKKVKEATALFYGAEQLDRWAKKFENAHRIELFRLVPADSILEIRVRFGKSRDQVIGPDPHFWTDPLTVKALLPALVEQLSDLDPDGSQEYHDNARKFASRLQEVSDEITRMLAPARNRKVLLSHPFFQYFLRRYRIPLVGIIETIPGTEPTPKELARIIRVAAKERVKAVLVHAQHSDRPAKLVAESTGAKIVKIDPLGGAPGRESYEALLRYNARNILEALQ